MASNYIGDNGVIEKKDIFGKVVIGISLFSIAILVMLATIVILYEM